MDIFDGLAESTRLEFRPLVPARGNIYDRNGLPLAEEDGRTVQLYMSQNSIPNYDDCLNTLSRVLHLEVSTLERVMHFTDKRPASE
jgi:penicillin-binding protein 2